MAEDEEQGGVARNQDTKWNKNAKAIAKAGSRSGGEGARQPIETNSQSCGSDGVGGVLNLEIDRERDHAIGQPARKGAEKQE